MNPTRDTLLDDLRALGVRPGDLLMIHGSVRALGLAHSQGVERGAERMLSALTEAVGGTGTLLMILGSEYAFDWVNQRPVAERAGLLAGTPPFRHQDASVLTEVGFLAEAFRTWPGVALSANPSGRFASWGARAAELLHGQPWHDYYGPGSPLEKLCAWGGRILRLGASFDTTTVLHYAEYVAKLPNKRRTRWDYLLDTPAGPKHTWIECLDDSEGIAHWEGEDYFAVILKAYLAENRHRAGRVGAAASELLDANDLLDFAARWMEENLRTAP
ncbi:MAG TPA: AAC(3) family N-acetyltransferase [Polyangiales bacterium]